MLEGLKGGGGGDAGMVAGFCMCVSEVGCCVGSSEDRRAVVNVWNWWRSVWSQKRMEQSSRLNGVSVEGSEKKEGGRGGGRSIYDDSGNFGCGCG